LRCSVCGSERESGDQDAVIGKIAALLRDPDRGEITLDRIADVVRDAGEDDSASRPAVSNGWHPADDAHSGTVTRLLELAHDAGVMTSPPGWGIAYEYASDADGAGYRWLLICADEDRALILADAFADCWSDSTGATAAFDLLCDAAGAGNQMLADLARYTASSAPATPSPGAAGPARFVRDEPRAAAWASQGVTQHDEGGGDWDETLPDIGSAYCPAMDLNDTATSRLIRTALAAGIIADTQRGPDALDVPSLVWEFADGGDEGACRWLLYGAAGEPILASQLQSMASLGGPGGCCGPGRPLAVLRAAVRAANALASQRAALGLDRDGPHA
jgi:hypothetical protein